MLKEVEHIRRAVFSASTSKKKSRYSQFFTSAKIAQFMAGLYVNRDETHCHLLDAGAGIGSLSTAFLELCASGRYDFKHLKIDAFEIDDELHPYLTKTFEKYSKKLDVTSKVRGGDFIHIAVHSLSGDFFAEKLPSYTHAILNPPYKKMRSNSAHRLALRKVGLETVNLYTAFVALSLSLLENRGQLVAIIPRSFCNGPYYRPFREYLLKRAAICHIHLFASRNKAFKDDDVLQENLILLLERGASQSGVTVSTSTDDSFADIDTHEYSFDRIVNPEDSQHIIHIPSSPEITAIERSNSIQFTLKNLGIMISTGPVVDFRVKEHLRHLPEANTIPLIYPSHFNGWTIDWPKPEQKKPNAIQRNPSTEKWLYPNGHYCIVRRFSSKEEKRRVVASVVNPGIFEDVEVLGFENHLNIFHEHKHGLPEAIAFGLAVFLNSSVVDEYFRCFNGHTQVNATDLKMMKYPSREALISLGKWAMCKNTELTQIMLDKKMEELIT